MTTVSGAPAEAKAGRTQRVALRLYLAGVTPNSRRAQANLEAALAEQSPATGAYGLEVIDVLSDARRVMTDNIIVTPTLIGIAPSHRLVMVGDLSDAAKLRDFLKALFDGG
jgi:hypothetical protein